MARTRKPLRWTDEALQTLLKDSYETYEAYLARTAPLATDCERDEHPAPVSKRTHLHWGGVFILGCVVGFWTVTYLSYKAWNY